MNHTQSLPEPDSHALQHSQKLVECIRDEIKNNNGSITFRRYMEMALYEPSLGYYVSGAHKIGAGGDFTTAPEISPLFSRCIANHCAKNIQKVGGCTSAPLSIDTYNILELGAGSGVMAADILIELEKQALLPKQYYILDLSPDLIERQQKTLRSKVPHLVDRVQWLNQLPKNFEGMIIGNEVLDAMPVDVFTQQNDTVFEHHVIWQDNQLIEQLKPARDSLKKVVLDLKIPHHATPYTSEINPNLDGWFTSLNQCLKAGVILLIDYGYSQTEYYLDERNKGTLICHYQHLVNEAPLYYPGLQDITANVDFTAVAEAADNAGFKVKGFVPQATFLTNTDLESYFVQALNNKPDDQYKVAQQVRSLSLPTEMGERFKCIALTKNHDEPLLGFEPMNQLHRL